MYMDQGADNNTCGMKDTHHCTQENETTKLAVKYTWKFLKLQRSQNTHENWGGASLVYTHSNQLQISSAITMAIICSLYMYMYTHSSIVTLFIIMLVKGAGAGWNNKLVSMHM